MGSRPLADAARRLDGRQPPAQFQGSLDLQGQGRSRRQRGHAQVRGAVRVTGLRRGRAAREVVTRLQDSGHLRGHAADPAADHCQASAGEELGGTEVNFSGRHRTKSACRPVALFITNEL